jgi:hypothetical protein
MRRAVLLLAALSLAVPAAFAADTDRVVVAPGLGATITTVDQYARASFDGDSGTWQGPSCRSRARPELVWTLALSWALNVYRSASAAEAGNRARTFDWDVAVETSVPVPHVVAGRPLGSIPARLVVTDSHGLGGYHEASLAFRLDGRRFVAARAWSHGNVAACLVDGDGTASEWHGRTARAALETIRVEGNLPPARVGARRVGRFVRGTAVDVHGHPLVGAAVALERRNGRTWRVVRRGKTARAGSYALRVGAAGPYRVAVSAAGLTARSRAVRA